MRLADGVLQRLLQRLPALSFLQELCCRFRVELAALEVNVLWLQLQRASTQWEDLHRLPHLVLSDVTLVMCTNIMAGNDQKTSTCCKS
jgi:hypothetical protein